MPQRKLSEAEKVFAEDFKLRADPKIQKDYGDLLGLFPNHPISRYNGAVRWVADPLMRWIANRDMLLNDMCIAYQRGAFPLQNYAKFYRDLGYSLCGYIDVMGDYLGLYDQEEGE